MNTQTEAALEKAVEVFAAYKDDSGLARHSGFSYSPRYLTRHDWHEMNRQFDMEVLLYSDAAILLRHFLPCFLKWLIEDFPGQKYGSMGWLSLSFQLHHFRWLEWPAEEVEAVRAVFDSWIDESWNDSEGQFPIDFLLEIQVDVLPYLEIWLEKRPHELADRLWTINWQENQSVWQWATQPHVEAALEAEFFRHPDGPRAQSISRAIELIRSLRG